MREDLRNRFNFHFIGIGGIGMSGIALALIKKGYSISGSDVIYNEQTRRMKALGAQIFHSQDTSNIDIILKKFPKKNIFIVKSSAISTENIEFQYCIKQKLPIRHRSEILSLIMKSYNSIAVAGTHGKTSTSTFLSTLLDQCTNNASSIIGGIQPYYESNCHIKKSKYLVAEIDESDGSNIIYKSNLGIINNIDFDHCDYYSDLQDIICTFKKFEANSKQLLTNYDCKVTRKHINSDFNWSVNEIKDINFALLPKHLDFNKSIAEYYENGVLHAELNIPIPGLHNLSNVAAAIAACRINNISIEIIKQKLSFLKLPKKRFEFKGKLSERIIIDDYAHHPNEINATLKLGRLFINSYKAQTKRLVAIFQPHRYSRVIKLAKEFGKELGQADLIILTEIFSAGEENTDNISSQIIANHITNINKNVIILKDNYELKKEFFTLTKEGDFIINMGAGNCHELYNLLKEKFR